MKTKFGGQSCFSHPNALLGATVCFAGVVLALLALAGFPRRAAASPKETQSPAAYAIAVYHHGVSPALSETAQAWSRAQKGRASETPVHPLIPNSLRSLGVPLMPGPLLNFDGIPFPGVSCNCGPPSMNGAAGLTQYVQIVNRGYQVFDKSTGASILGPVDTNAIWAGSIGACQTSRSGNATVLFDQLANRWVIAEAANSGQSNAECIAVSTTSDATGTYYRYEFSFGSNLLDSPSLAVWPDAYYLSARIFSGGGVTYLGPQAFALERARVINGQTPNAVAFNPLGPSVDSIMPADLDGSMLPPPGAPATFVSYPGSGQYKIYHFHVDFATPANSTFTTFATPAAAAFTPLCPSTSSCVPQIGTSVGLNGRGGQLMPRLTYRNFCDHESVVGNYAVYSNGVAGLRWFELRNVTNGPVTVFQESIYQPDTTWRWLGSAAMDRAGNLAIGFSASNSSIFPSIRYAGRLANDPLNSLAQGEATLINGAGSQTSPSWGAFSSMSIDPVDDRTFWYTNEYLAGTSIGNWRTRIGSFRFPQAAPVVQSAISRKTHGSAGSFDVDLPLNGTPGIECRSGGATNDYEIVLTFSAPVTVTGSPQAQVTSGTGQVGTAGVNNACAVSASGALVRVPLTNVANAQTIQLTLFGVSDGTNTGDVVIPVSVLIGDTNANGAVNSGDVSQAKARIGQTLDATNFRSDVNANGAINAGDVSIIKANLGTGLP